MAAMITQCPYCATAFAVNEAQLQAAAGNVRCGACLNVFLAEDNLLTIGADTAAVDQREPETDDQAEAGSDESISEFAEDEVAAESFDEDHEQVQSSDEPSAGGFASFSAADPAWELLDEEADDDDEASLDEESVDDGCSDLSDKADEDEAVDFLDDEGGAADFTDADDGPSDPLPDYDSGRREPSLFGLDDDLLEDERPARFSAANRAALDEVAAPVELHAGRSSDINGLRLAGSIMLALFLCATIGLQLLWFQREDLALQEDWRPRIEMMCSVLPCEVAPRQDLAAISSDNLVVRSHPEARNALLVSLNFRNDASFPQPFPTLTLRFTDTDQQAVAMREFLPQEYLQEELRGMRMMPANTTVQARVDIVDPGTEAINYEVFLGPAD